MNEIDDNFNLICSCEQKWVKKLSRWDFSIGEFNEYFHNGLEDFNKDDGVPMTLKVNLFKHYLHWSHGGNGKGFKEWYLKNYKNRLKEKNKQREKDTEQVSPCFFRIPLQLARHSDYSRNGLHV